MSELELCKLWILSRLYIYIYVDNSFKYSTLTGTRVGNVRKTSRAYKQGRQHPKLKYKKSIFIYKYIYGKQNEMIKKTKIMGEQINI